MKKMMLVLTIVGILVASDAFGQCLSSDPVAYRNYSAMRQYGDQMEINARNGWTNSLIQSGAHPSAINNSQAWTNMYQNSFNNSNTYRQYHGPFTGR